MVGALALLLVSVIATVSCVSWVWNKADALTPVDLPSANGSPLKTVNPTVRPSITTPPRGRVIGTNMVASNKDQMPVLSSAWADQFDYSGLYGSVGTWLTVHKDYDGTKDWGNYVAFGALAKSTPYSNTPAGLKEATVQTAAKAVTSLYSKDVKFIGKAVHKPIKVQGRPGHELTIKISVKVPKLQETFSTFAVAVVDRGDGTADACVGDFAGSTPQWLPIWRAKVKQITVAR